MFGNVNLVGAFLEYTNAYTLAYYLVEYWKDKRKSEEEQEDRTTYISEENVVTPIGEGRHRLGGLKDTMILLLFASIIRGSKVDTQSIGRKLVHQLHALLDRFQSLNHQISVDSLLDARSSGQFLVDHLGQLGELGVRRDEDGDEGGG